MTMSAPIPFDETMHPMFLAKIKTNLWLNMITVHLEYLQLQGRYAKVWANKFDLTESLPWKCSAAIADIGTIPQASS